MAWIVETLNETVDAELAELPSDMRARLVRISELIQQVGLPNVREPHVRHVHFLCAPQRQNDLARWRLLGLLDERPDDHHALSLAVT